MKNKIKVLVGLAMTIGFILKPVTATTFETLLVTSLAIVGGLIALDGLVKIEF